MKREIKYRGKRLDGKGWAVGLPCYNINGGLCIQVPVRKVKDGFYVPDILQPIDPETVGEYTGMKGIFEDDIISVRFGPDNSPIPMRVLFENGSWCMKEYWDDTLHDLYSYEDEIEGVLGNMFDSPEKFITE